MIETLTPAFKVGMSRDALFFQEGDIVVYDNGLPDGQLAGVGLVTARNQISVAIRWWNRGKRRFSDYAVNVEPERLYRIGWSE